MADAAAIHNLLTSMREPEDEKNFKDYLKEAWKLLELDGKPDLISFEALLIEAVECITIGKNDKLSRQNYKRAVRRKDTYLLMLGLLDDYYHTKADGTHYSASERHKKYLENNPDYILVEYFSSLTPSEYDKYDIEKKKADARMLISKDDERGRTALSYFLSQKSKVQNCLVEGTKKFIKCDTNGNRYIDLPVPCYTLKNFPREEAPDLKTTNDQENTQPNENIEENVKDTSLNELTPTIENHEDSEATSTSSRIPHGRTPTVPDDTETDALLKKYLHDIHKLISYSRALCVAVIVLIIVLVPISMYLLLDRIMYTAKSSQIPEMPVIESDAMKNAEVIAELARPRIEDFKLQKDKLPLIPGETKNLKEIMDLFPPDGSMSSLIYESSNKEIVSAEHGYVTASKNIEEGNYYIDVTITTLNEKKDIVHIEVENLPIPDDSMPKKGGGIQK